MPLTIISREIVFLLLHVIYIIYLLVAPIEIEKQSYTAIMSPILLIFTISEMFGFPMNAKSYDKIYHVFPDY